MRSHRHSAVDVEHLTGDEPGRGGGEIEDPGADLRGVSEAADGRHVEHVLERRSGMPSVIRVLMNPGAIAFTVTPLRAYSSAKVLVNPIKPGLGGRVVRLTEVADAADDARYIDDAAPAARGHRVDEASSNVESAVQVGVDHFIPRVPVHLLEGAVAGDSGVVDQDVDGLEVIPDARAHCLDFAAHRDVKSVRLRPASQLANLAAHFLGSSSPGGGGSDCDVGPRRRQRKRAARPMPREAPVTNALLPSKLKLGKSRWTDSFVTVAVAIGASLLEKKSRRESAGSGS